MKNGETNETDFSLVYELDSRRLTFFPDYIVQRSDGKIGLYETKAVKEAFEEGTSERVKNQAKMGALRDWIAEDPERRSGAFVVKTDSGVLRWGLDIPPVGTDGNKMADLFD